MRKSGAGQKLMQRARAASMADQVREAAQELDYSRRCSSLQHCDPADTAKLAAKDQGKRDMPF